MLHELLFALNGHPGMIFVLQGNRFKVNESLPFFHPSEKGILNQLLDVATDFWKLEQFIKEHKHAALGPSQYGLRGLYIEALCNGIDQVLMDYRKSIVELEKLIVKTGDARLSHIQHRVIPHQPVLRSLSGIINLIMLRQSHGCAVLDIVYRAYCTGVEKVHDAIQRILQECHKIFYKQLLTWLLQGSLHDPFQEFFIGTEDVIQKQVSDDGSATEVRDDRVLSQRHILKAEMLPCHISVAVAEKIFFVGESIQLFERDRKLESQGAVLKDKEAEFYAELAQLRDSAEFQVADFEQFIDNVREAASRHLHDLVLQTADLKSELSFLRSFFLLERGELFQSFIEEADSYLSLPPTPSTRHDVSQAFIGTCRQLLMEDDVISNKIRVQVTIPQSKSPTLIGWECLSLDYQVQYPLHLIITPEVLERYNAIFRFLLSVKRAQLMLHERWARHIKNKKAHQRSNDSTQLQTHMIFVVDNLQHYLMADVLESQFSMLLKRIGASTNFEQLRHAHGVFLTSITAHTFITNRPVHQCLSGLLSSCMTFCRSIDVDIELEDQSKIVSSVATDFSRHSSLLFKLLASIRNRQTGSQLSQLLLRIDYNRYFSKHGHNIGTFV